ncbi:uncharacterized protein TNCT_378641 [Trichonephila clavata]|uniref:C2H2-type domain-containing protein n=1 Tax=Trichonephila clavata TaxID=2740835 RepID=A0A8X6F0R6_TRICU|nr:uncharacterized protein TNCT_378641 [Trichonephila clavata]
MNHVRKHRTKNLHCSRDRITSNTVTKFSILHTKGIKNPISIQTSTSFGVGQINEKCAKNRSKPPSMSPELSSIPLCISKWNPYFYPNQQSMSAKYNQMNPQVKANEQAVGIVHEIKSTMYGIPTPSHRILNEMDLKFEYSKRNPKTMDFADRSKRVCEEPKHRHNETPIEQNIPGRSLNSKKKGIECNLKDKNTDRRGSVEEKFQGNSNSSRRRTDAGEEIKACDAVEDIFNVKPIFVTDPATSTEKKPYVCDICEKRFPFKSHLKQHYLIHFGEKPHLCNVREKGFSAKSNLTVHYASHSEERLYRCETCDKTFRHKRGLVRHYRNTLQYILQKCRLCVKCAVKDLDGKRGNLKQHYITHTKHEQYVCKTCGKEYKYQKNFKNDNCAPIND